ncbi:FUSC family protein [Rugosimonospora africana]|uniref:FUSC family protein n=1 Tax=Rugosimonospora africana TaxID=556532 RepID=UPI0019418933|nr:FUSC family protein [Rugosimonospora africana]
MIGAGILDRLRHRDPGFRISLRALRLTIAAIPAYYVCLYGIHNKILATYVIFGTIAAGIFIQLPGSARQRASAILAAIPVACGLIALGTALNVNLWAAVIGTLVIGFSVAYFSVAGPRLLGLASGLQLFYLVANFSPHHLAALPARLIGASIGMALAAAAEVLLWRAPPPVTYEQRVAEAAEAAADLLDASSEVVAGRAAGDGEMTRQQQRTAQAIRQTRVRAIPVPERPTSAGRRDRALRDAAWTTWEVAEQVRRFMTRPQLGSHHDANAAEAMRRSATTMRTAGRSLTRGETPPDIGEVLSEATPGFEPIGAPGTQPADIERRQLRLSLQSIVEHVDFFTVAVRVATREPTVRQDKRLSHGATTLWYARHSDLSLVWQELRRNLTPRSAFFQSALRLAVALAAARAVTGVLNLSHGFWVLLATLTVMRTSALNTRTTLIRSVLGALIGAVATGLVLTFVDGALPYAMALLVAAVLAFGVGKLLGTIWSQAALTATVTLVFAQLAPSDWRLASVRLVDVLAGGAVGITAGLVMWPRGAGAELWRRVGAYLRADADLIQETIAVLTGRGRYSGWPRGALNGPLREYIPAEASICQYYTERPDPRFERVYWEAFLVTGVHVMHGAEFLLLRNRPGLLAGWPEAAATVTDIAEELRRGYRTLAEKVPEGSDHPMVAPMDGAMISDQVATIVASGGGRSEDVCLLEIGNWLASLSENLDWLQTASGRPPGPWGST